MTPSVDPYRVLGLTPGASLNEIRSAYRRLAKQYHPDAAGERALPRFLAIQAAYERLVDGEGRLRQTARPARALAPLVGGPGSGARDTGRVPGAAAGLDHPRIGRERRADRRARRPGHAAVRPMAPARARARNGRPAANVPARTRARRRPGRGARHRAAGSRAARRPPAPRRTTRPPRRRSIPEWEGAGWYGPASGTYWTINPREYADPRKHGPEYQARARRAAEVEAQRARRRTRGDPPPARPTRARPRRDPVAPPAGSTPETEAAGAAAGWAWTGEGSRPARRPARPAPRPTPGAGDWSAEALVATSRRPTTGPAASARAAASRAPRVSGADVGDPARPRGAPCPSGPAKPARDRGPGRRAEPGRRWRSSAWPPLGFAAASCSTRSPAAPSSRRRAPRPPRCSRSPPSRLIVAALVLLPLLAAITAFASVATLVVALPLAAALSALVGPDVAVGRGVLIVAAIGAYFVGLVGAVVPRGPRRATLGQAPAGRGQHHVSRRDPADISAAAQEYLLALRVMASDGRHATASQVGRHLGVSTQAASEMFKRLTADGLVDHSERSRPGADPRRPRRGRCHLPTTRAAGVAADQRGGPGLGGE